MKPCRTAMWAGPGVMHARLSKILELEREGNVAVQVSFFPAGVHATIPRRFTQPAAGALSVWALLADPGPCCL
jgi:hypothetical protein